MLRAFRRVPLVRWRKHCREGFRKRPERKVDTSPFFFQSLLADEEELSLGRIKKGIQNNFSVCFLSRKKPPQGDVRFFFGRVGNNFLHTHTHFFVKVMSKICPLCEDPCDDVQDGCCCRCWNEENGFYFADSEKRVSVCDLCGKRCTVCDDRKCKELNESYEIPICCNCWDSWQLDVTGARSKKIRPCSGCCTPATSDEDDE